MRNIRFVNLIQRLNTLNKNSNAILKQTNLLRVNSKAVESCFNGQSRQYSSSNQAKFDFNRSSIFYNLFGASIAGGITVNCLLDIFF